MELKTCALYIRVSTEDQTELSPDAQKRLLIDYAKKNNMIVAEVFQDDGISGRKANKRPEFQRMIGIAKLKEHPFDVILVWKFSRFARNQEESIVYKSLLKKNNVDVVSISEPLPDGMIGSLVERIFEWMDEYYSINLSAEVKRGMTENALRGNYQGSCPLGYDSVGYKEVPVVNEKEAVIVRLIFQKFVGGDTFKAIANYLNMAGYRTKKNGAFESRVVRYILQNPFYIGKVRWNYYDRENFQYKDSDEVIIVDGKHEPIIDMVTWNAAQERLSHYLLAYKRRDTSTVKHWLSSMMVCSCCGKNIAHTGSGFQCQQYTKGKCNESHYIREKIAEDTVIDGLKNVIQNPNMQYEIKIVRKNISESSELSNLEIELEKLKVKEAKIKAAYIDGIDTLEEYKENKTILNSEKEKIVATIEKIKSVKAPEPLEAKKNFMNKLESVITTLEDENADTVEKGNAIRSVVDYIVFDRVHSTFDFHFISFY